MGNLGTPVRLKVFTDGSFAMVRGEDGFRRGEGGWGAVFALEDKVFLEVGGYLERATSNRAELIAAIQAIHIAGGYARDLELPFCLYTDSNYLYSGITEWIESWRVRGWRTVQGKPVLNRDLWEHLDSLSQWYGVRWHWVSGHGNCWGNRRADEIARGFRRKNPPSLVDDGRLAGFTLLPLDGLESSEPFLEFAFTGDNFLEEEEEDEGCGSNCALRQRPSAEPLPPWNWVVMLPSSGGEAMAKSEAAARMKVEAEVSLRWLRRIAHIQV